MTITTLEQGMVGMQPMTTMIKQTANITNGHWQSGWGLAGSPPAGSFNTTLTGGTYACGPANANLVGGQIYRLDPPTPKRAYLGRGGCIPWGTGYYGTCILCDRIWDNGGWNMTSTGVQTISSFPALPSRDESGGTAGIGVLWGVEISSTIGTASANCTITYTNSSGASGHTATLTELITTAAPTGAFFRGNLQSGDRGIQSIQSFQLSQTLTSGVANLVAYRVLGHILFAAGNSYAAIPMMQDMLTGGFQRVWNGTVPFVLFQINVNIPGNSTILYQETWG